jgi:hypothetical protein
LGLSDSHKSIKVTPKARPKHKKWINPMESFDEKVFPCFTEFSQRISSLIKLFPPSHSLFMISSATTLNAISIAHRLFRAENKD